MKMQQLTNGTGWFDLDRAECVDEQTKWDGHNHISLATGSQWDHETLYLTAQGHWVIQSDSQRQGVTPAWKEIPDDDALTWILRNHYEPEELPERMAEAIREQLAAREI